MHGYFKQKTAWVCNEILMYSPTAPRLHIDDLKGGRCFYCVIKLLNCRKNCSRALSWMRVLHCIATSQWVVV